MLQFMREDSDDILLDMGRLQNSRATVSEHVMAGWSVLYVVETCMQIQLFSYVEFHLTGCCFKIFPFLFGAALTSSRASAWRSRGPMPSQDICGSYNFLPKGLKKFTSYVFV